MRKKEFKVLLVREEKTQGDVARALGISETTMCAKLAKGVFGSDEIEKMIKFLHIEDPAFIFFGEDVALKDTEQGGETDAPKN